jgi:hypothetical protein
VNKRSTVVVAVLAVLPVPLLAASASAHGEHKVDNHTVEVGFGTEPAYAGVTNSVQLVSSDNGRPVTDAKGLKVAVTTGHAEPKELVLQPYFGADLGEPGDDRAFFIPTIPGPYTFKVTGTLGGSKVDQRYTSGKDGFDEVTDPAEARRLATIGLAVGALGLLTAVGVGVVALRRRS